MCLVHSLQGALSSLVMLEARACGTFMAGCLPTGWSWSKESTWPGAALLMYLEYAAEVLSSGPWLLFMGEDLPGCEQEIHGKAAAEEVELVRREYTANGGWETFLSYEDVRQDILIGLLRLRRLPGARSIVRELHVYGSAVAVHLRDTSKHQHQVSSLFSLAAKLSLHLTDARTKPFTAASHRLQTPEDARAQPAESMWSA